MRVLLIGSDREILHMTERILRRNDCDASAAAGWEEAGEWLLREPFDLVLLDWDMGSPAPGDMLRSIREAPGKPKLLLISGDRADEVPLLEAGADDWIQKPYPMKVLLARMAALLRQKS